MSDLTLEQMQKISAMMQEQQSSEAQQNRYDAAVGNLSEEDQTTMFADHEGAKSEQMRQLERANALRSGGATQGVQAGNQFVAANPWSLLADVAKQGVGAYKAGQAEDTMKANASKIAGAKGNLADLLRANQQQEGNIDPTSLVDYVPNMNGIATA